MTALPGDWHEDRVVLTLEDNTRSLSEVITTTLEHPFHVPGRGVVKAEHLKAGMVVSRWSPSASPLQTVGFRAAEAASGHLLVKAITITRSGIKLWRAYNLTVAQDHTFFVGKLNAWVHNALPCGRITQKLTIREAGALRGQARRIWENANGSRAGLDIHHRIPLEWAHLFPDTPPNRLPNLIGLSNAKPNGGRSYHQQVNGIWSAFKRSNSNPSAIDVMRVVSDIDRRFGHFYNRRR